MKHIAVILIAGLVLVHCGELERDNPLDPKNPNAAIDQTVAVELFVNDSTGYEFCRFATEAMERLAQQDQYRDKLCVLEYHLTNRSHGWNDIYALDEFNQRYYRYVPISSERGIPDAMFNGLIRRVQGASLENIEQRYLQALVPLLGQSSPFYIQATKKFSSNAIQLDVKLGMYGNRTMENLELNVILYEDLNLPGHRFLVRKILQEQTIPRIRHGDIKSFCFSAPLPEVTNIGNLYAVVLVQDQQSADKEILQAARF